MLDLSFYDIKGSVLSVVSVIDGADDRLSCPNKYLLSKIDIVFYRCLKLIGIDSVEIYQGAQNGKAQIYLDYFFSQC